MSVQIERARLLLGQNRYEQAEQELGRLLVEDGRKAGHTFSQPDLIIAATALDHGLTVVSRDVSDYRKARVPVHNPWRYPLPRD